MPKQFKMIEPTYQELKDSQIPRSSNNGVNVKIIAGSSMGVTSSVYTRTPMMYLDFKLDPGTSFSQQVPKDWNAFIVILNGSGLFGSSKTRGNAHHTLVFSKEGRDMIEFKNDQSHQLHFVLIAGQPLNEPGIFLKFNTNK